MNKFSIITPCFNAANYIEDTMLSVVNNRGVQSGKIELEYIICDGASTDRTMEIVQRIADAHQRPNITFKISSEPDNGMYDALSKGLAQVTGNICAYQNASDVYSPTAFNVAEAIMNDQVRWIIGMNVLYTEDLQMVVARTPPRYRTSLIRKGMYDAHLLPYIQQESTFWHSELIQLIDLDKLRSYQLAGDFYLWHSFAASEKLYSVDAWISGFRLHDGQLSTSLVAYEKEIASIAGKPNPALKLLAIFDRVISYFPIPIKKLFEGGQVFRFQRKTGGFSR